MLEHEIRTALQRVKELRQKIEARMIAAADKVTDFDEVELSEANINARIETLADQLINTYPDRRPVLVGLLDGALPFASKLNAVLSARNYPFEYTCMQVSSYGAGMVSGELVIGAMPKIELGERLVIIVDDVCDTGKTYRKTEELIRDQFGAAEVQLMALVDKVQPRPAECQPKFSGFKVSNKAFIIGFGLDFSGLLRNLRSILSVDLASLPTPEEKAVLAEERPLNERLRAMLAAAPSLGRSRDVLLAAPREEGPKVPGIESQTVLSI